MESLASKYRPKTFEETLSQASIIQILKKQVEAHEYANCYLLAGPSGCGKTTIARIFANEINGGLGNPIEIDGASNNGVDNVRTIIDNACARAIDAEYKIYIIDECHSISSQGWQAFLKCIEEPPEYTIFIFCTTDPQKIPGTILNRVMRFNLSKVPTQDIYNRLIYICKQEGYTNYEEAADYISKISSGCVREAISYLDKCSRYSKDLSIQNVIKTLGTLPYTTMMNLTNALVDRNEKEVINTINTLYLNGMDLKIVLEQYLDFILDLNMYILFKDMSVTRIPLSLEGVGDVANNPLCIKYVVGFEGSKKYFGDLVQKLLDIKNQCKFDTNIKSTLIISLLKICRGA